MALDFNILARAPDIGAQIMAGQEAGRARAAQNMLLQQRQLEFKQAQEDRSRKLEAERLQTEARPRLAQMLRQMGQNPGDLKAATEFTAAAFESNNPAAVTAGQEWIKLARDLAQSEAARTEYQGIMGGGAPAVAAPVPSAMPMAAAPMAMAPAPAVAPTVAPMAPETPALDERGVNRAAWMAKAGLEEDIAPPPVNQLAPQVPAAPPVNQLAAAPAPAPAAAPTPAPAKDDAAALRAEAQRLEAQQQRLRQSGFKANQERAKELDKPIERLYKRAEDVEKATPSTQPKPEKMQLGDRVAFVDMNPNSPTFRQEILSQQVGAAPGDRTDELERQQRRRASLPVGSRERAEVEARIKRLTEEQKGTTVNLGVQAFTPASERAQETLMAALTEERKALRNAPMMIKNVEAARQLIPGASAFMGKGGEPFLALASFLNNRLGFSFNTKGVADATELNTRLFEGILENLKKLDSQPTVQQQNALKEALGSLNTDPGALPRILDRIEDSLRDRVDQFNQDVASARENKVLFPLDPTIKLPPRVRPAAIPTAPAAAPAPAAAAAPAASGAFPAPPQKAIDRLKRGEGTDAQFDEIFGPGAAAKVRGGR